MSNLFDYLAWRGDLTFGNAPLSPVDALAFSVLAYIRLEDTVSADPSAEPVRLSDAAKRYFSNPVTGDTARSGNDRFFETMAASARFGPLRLFGAQKELDREDGIQFAAISILLPGQNIFVSFEGTDDTLVGWEEDLRMSYECPVPAQLRAVEYLRTVAAAHPLRRIYVGGHSKGGNLAMYAAVHSGPAVRYRIRAVYNNDGPGFCDDTLSSAEYAELRDRIHTYLPQSSIVGVLLEHDTNYKIVQSSAKGLLQHDPLSWEILGADFVYAAARTAFGEQTEAIIDRFVNEWSPARKRQFGEALFTVLESTNQETLSGIANNKMQSLRNVLRSFGNLEPEVREVLIEAVAALNRSRKAVRRARAALPESEKSS